VRRPLTTAFLAAALSGCAAVTGGQPVGRDFSRAPFAGFTLDSTSVSEAEAALGPPMKLTTVRGLVAATSKRLVPGTPYAVTELSYYFFPNGMGAASQGHAGKFASLVFFDGRLIAYGAHSSLPGDANAPVDEGRLDSLHQCQTTRREAIALLGQPDAESLHILDAQPGAIDIVYTWQNTRQGVAAHRSLRVFFDRNGAMSNYTLVDNENALGGVAPALHPPLPAALPPACPNITDRQHT
jgi:hypothetical protein